MRYAIVENGVVSNIALADGPLVEWGEETVPVTGWFEWTDGVAIGDLFDGEVFTKPEPVVEVPQAVTQRQARLALLAAGLLAAVQPALDSLPSPQREAAQIEWDWASTIKRDSPLIVSVGAALGLTDEQIDALFIAAAVI